MVAGERDRHPLDGHELPKTVGTTSDDPLEAQGPTAVTSPFAVSAAAGPSAGTADAGDHGARRRPHAPVAISAATPRRADTSAAIRPSLGTCSSSSVGL